MGEVEYDGEGSFLNFVIAGAAAGTAEHCGMYPVDTVKTHLQAVRPALAQAQARAAAATAAASATVNPGSTVVRPPRPSPTSARSTAARAAGGGGGAAGARGVAASAQSAASVLVNESVSAARAAQELYRLRGAAGFFRGMSAVLWGAAPSHAVYFTTYEYAKRQFGAMDPHDHRPMATAGAGMVATMVGDLFHVPMDTVKQRMQLKAQPYRTAWHCVSAVMRAEGPLALYRSYTTTLIMNVPFSAAYFASYESAVKLYYSAPRLTQADYEPVAHWLAGASAGAVAAACTNPLDVAKTRLQTQGRQLAASAGAKESAAEVASVRPYLGMTNTVSLIWKEEGARAFLLGIGPRMLFHSTASALAWSVYEFVKYKLN